MLSAWDLWPRLQLTTRGRSSFDFSYRCSSLYSKWYICLQTKWTKCRFCFALSDSVIMIKPTQKPEYPFKDRLKLKTSTNVSSLQSFPVRSLGWMEMAEQDLSEGRSSVAVHHCIRQLSYCRRDIRDSAGVWGEVGVWFTKCSLYLDSMDSWSWLVEIGRI